MHGLCRQLGGPTYSCKVNRRLFGSQLQTILTRRSMCLDTSTMSTTDYTNWSHEKLVSRVTELEQKLRTQNESSLQQLESINTASKSEPHKRKGFDPSKYATRFIALKIAYLGGKYSGFEHHTNNSTPLPTVEEILWHAMRKTCLIQPENYNDENPNAVSWKGCDYSKCGRTDKGVSAYGQVVGIRVRSNRPLLSRNSADELGTRLHGVLDGQINDENSTGRQLESSDTGVIEDNDPSARSTNGTTNNKDASQQQENPFINFDDVRDEISYARMLNRVLPEDVKVLAWCPSPPPGFDARYSCKERHYKYFFTQPAFPPIPDKSGLYQHADGSISRMGWLDIDAMKEAASYFIGLHDFRNFCKIDPAKQITNFNRRIYYAGIEEWEPANPPLSHLYQSQFLPYFDDAEDKSYRARERFKIHCESREGGNPQVKSVETRNPKIFSFTIRGSAFLWHQVRHLVAVLFLVGQGLEKPSIVKDLLDAQKMPRKPSYELAAAEPLVLYDCAFSEDEVHKAKDGLEWVYVPDKTCVSGETQQNKSPPGIFGKSEIANQIWQLWHRKKVDEVLSAAMLGVVAKHGLKTLSTYPLDDPKRSLKRNCRVCDGSDNPKPIGTYVPVSKMRKLDDLNTINARYYDRKGRDKIKYSSNIGQDGKVANTTTLE